MKKIILLFTLIATTHILFAQQDQVKWGKPEKYSKLQLLGKRTVLGVCNNYFYAYGSGDIGVFGGIKNYEILRSDLNTANIERLELNLESDKVERQFESCIFVKGKIYVLSSFHNKKHKKHYLFAQTVNTSNFTLNQDMKKIAELDYEGESKKSPCSFGLTISPDSSKILVSYTLTNDENEILRSGFTVYDFDFNEIRKVNEISSGIQGTFLFQEYAVDSSANVYITGKLYADEKKLKYFPENGKLYLIAYPKYIELPVPVEIRLPDNKYALRAKIGIDANSDVFCVGYFSQEEMNNAIGLFSVKYNVDSRTCGTVFIKNFDFDYLTKGMDDGDIKKIKKSMEEGENFEKHYYILDDIKFRENGTFTLVSEKYYETTITVYDGRTSRDIFYYYYGDIMVSNFNTSDGSFNWTQKVPRDIKIVNDLQSGSFGVIYGKNNTTHILYNAMRAGSLTGEAKFKESNLVVVSISDKGKESWKEINNAKKSDFFARPSEYFHVGENEFVVLGQSGSRKLAVGKYTMNFKE